MAGFSSELGKTTLIILFVSMNCLLTSTLMNCDDSAELQENVLRQLHENLTPTPSIQSEVPIYKLFNSPLPPSAVPEEATVLTSNTFNVNYAPEVGNGHIATVVASDTMLMNGLYNGQSITSHRARLQSTAGYSIALTSPPGLTRSYTLDLGRGLFTETYSRPDVNISLRTYAHRSFTSVLVNELVLERSDVSTPVGVKVNLNPGLPSEDVTLTTTPDGFIHGTSLTPEFKVVAPATDFFMLTSTTIEGIFEMSPGVKAITYVRLSAIDVDKDNVMGDYEAAKQAFLDGKLLAMHVSQWSDIWGRGRIDVTGDVTIAQQNYATLYYLLSSLPSEGNRKDWPFIGLSPGGLAHGVKGKDYNGHVFWDQDTWMFPPIALLHSDIGKTVVQTRTKTLGAAKQWAVASGYEGARFPWESAFTGFETCPAIPVGVMEIHINGDVSMMLRQYWQLTHDSELMLNGSGAEIVWETARYWASRVIHNATDDTYSILDVMPPDEFHSPVNDSAYTNNIAVLNLRLANQLTTYFNKTINATWATISDRLRLSYDPELDYHPEYQGFTLNESTKQADVVLLGFPLMVTMNQSTRRNDLMYYEKTTPTQTVPAMTWGMFLIGWLEMGDEAKAADLFNRSVLNSQEPFKVWSENADGSGATNFLTGMGGYLQSVLFGYGGCRIYDDMLSFNPTLVPRTTEVKFTGIDYRGSSFDLTYSEQNMTLTQTFVSSGLVGLEIKLDEAGSWQKLTTGINLTVKKQSFGVRTAES